MPNIKKATRIKKQHAQIMSSASKFPRATEVNRQKVTPPTISMAYRVSIVDAP
jgi:hypothetical protein